MSKESACLKTVKTFSRYVIYDSHTLPETAQSLLLNVESLLSQETIITLKNDPNTSVFQLRVAGVNVIIKRYNFRGFWYNVKRLVSTSRAMKSWRAGHLLIKLGFHTAKPLAMIEERVGFLKRRSYFVTEVIDGVLADTFFKAPIQTENAAEVAQAFVQLFKAFEKHHIIHGDTKATNFIVHHGLPYVIDCDAMRQIQSSQTFSYRHQKEKIRFMQNWENNRQAQELFQCLMAKKY